MQSLRLYVNAFNLFTITKYTGFDPEVNYQGNTTDPGDEWIPAIHGPVDYVMNNLVEGVATYGTGARAHAVPSAVEAAYKRTDFFDRRRDLMEAWGRFATVEGSAEVSGFAEARQ